MADVVYSVKGDLDQIRRHLSDMQRRVVPSVAASSLTGAARATRKAARADWKAQLGLPPGETGKRIRVSRASLRRLSARIIVNIRAVPVIRLRASQGKSGTKAGGKSYAHAWIGRRKDGHGGDQVFVRRGESRTPIDVVKIPIVGTGTRAVESRVKSSGALWKKLFLERLNAALNRRGISAPVGLED